ncbi:MAG: hypothetical protein WA842_08210 [Croceibacterium sp.]
MMTEERITEIETPTGNTHTTTTVVHDAPQRSGGGSWVLFLLVIVLAVVGLWAFSTMGGAEVNKDNAVAEAANDVGNAANQVGEAAQDAAREVTQPD